MRKLYKTAYHTNPMLAENKITLASLYKILFEEEPLTLSDQCMQKLEESFHFLKTFSNDKIIYGINTGFGPMAQYRIEDESLSQLQYNIIRSHATGAGQPLPELYVKAAMIARLYTFLQGKSGIHKELALLINPEKRNVPLYKNDAFQKVQKRRVQKSGEPGPSLHDQSPPLFSHLNTI